MKPRAISFEAGIGRCFADDMAEFVAQIRKELSKAFQSEDYEREKFLIESSEIGYIPTLRPSLISLSAK